MGLIIQVCNSISGWYISLPLILVSRIRFWFKIYVTPFWIAAEWPALKCSNMQIQRRHDFACLVLITLHDSIRTSVWFRNWRIRSVVIDTFCTAQSCTMEVSKSFDWFIIKLQLTQKTSNYSVLMASIFQVRLNWSNLRHFWISFPSISGRLRSSKKSFRVPVV